MDGYAHTPHLSGDAFTAASVCFELNALFNLEFCSSHASDGQDYVSSYSFLFPLIFFNPSLPVFYTKTFGIHPVNSLCRDTAAAESSPVSDDGTDPGGPCSFNRKCRSGRGLTSERRSLRRGSDINAERRDDVRLLLK